jgi:tetratricopeptide (TPR) repeat protein
MQMPTRFRLHDGLAALALWAMLATAWQVYHPGLQGVFLFDDFANLPSLGATGPVNTTAALWRYVTSGSADPTGRPIALLSFLIDAQDWPADPYPFKATSVLLHLLNGALLTWLLLLLGREIGCGERRSAYAAVLGAALWLLHPLLVSTTLYVVQREAMLPATFTLLGLIGYVVGRRYATLGQRLGVLLAAFAISAGTLLATLSKANGVLLPLLAWLVDALLLAPRHPIADSRTRRWFAGLRWLFLILPSLAVVAYLTRSGWTGFFDGMPAIRPWTLGQRLLTEARIVIEYLGLLWLPRPYTAGLFNDAIQVSTSLVSPPTTLFCIALIATLAGSSYALRRRHPALSAAILFYFAAHLLESTVIPLELYFEHRNYLPALLMFWPLALWICGDSSVANERTRKEFLGAVRIALAILLPLGLAALTFLRADVWGNARDQALLWAEKNPRSPRAQAYAAQIEIAHGRPEAAMHRLRAALDQHPDEIQLALNLIGAECRTGALTRATLDRAAISLRTARTTGRLGYDWFEDGFAIVRDGSCQGLDLAALKQLLDAAAANPFARAVSGRRQDIANLRARIALLERDGDSALKLFDSALEEDVRPSAGLSQAAQLASAGYYRQALEHLDRLDRLWRPERITGLNMASVHAWLLWRSGYWQHEIDHLRKQILADDGKVRENRAAPAPEGR